MLHACPLLLAALTPAAHGRLPLFELDLAGRSPERWLQDATLVIARITEAIGAIIVAIGVVRALWTWIAQRLPGHVPVATESIRLGLGRALGLALEFLLAADILSTAVAPSWDAIGKLAAIATIRTILNYFLGRELVEEERRRRAESPSERRGDERAAGGPAATAADSGTRD